MKSSLGLIISISVFLLNCPCLFSDEVPVNTVRSDKAPPTEDSKFQAPTQQLLPNSLESTQRFTLNEINRESAAIFEGTLHSAETVIAGKLLYTDYVFKVDDVFKGTLNATVSVRSLGGVLPDGSGMTTNYSLKLTPDQGYIVCLRPDYQRLTLPFLRVFQIHDNVVADEEGRTLVAITKESAPIYHPQRQFEPLKFITGKPTSKAPKQAPPPVPVSANTSVSVQSARSVSPKVNVLVALRKALKGGVK